MPYDSIQQAEKENKGLRKYSDKAKRGWIGSFNSCMADGGPEDKCFAIAYSVANKVDGRKPKKKQGAASDWEKKIKDAVMAKTDDEITTSIIAPWIIRGLIGNKFITVDLKNVRFSYKNSDHMSFSAKVLILLVDSGHQGWKSYKWRLRGKNYKGIISSDSNMNEIAAKELVLAARDIMDAR